MDRTAEQIRKAFKNTTPNVLDRVLSRGQHEKGVVIPMKEKKIVIPPALKKIASAAALLVLVLFAGYIGGITATAHYLANVPTETPTVDWTGYPAMNLTQEGFGQFLSSATAYEIWHYSDGATDQISYTVNGKTYTVQSMEKIYSTDEKTDLDAVRNSFADWNLADNQVSYGEIILSSPRMYLVVFDNGLVIGTIENFDGENSGEIKVRGYGEINRTLFFLPDAFCDLLRSKVGGQ